MLSEMPIAATLYVSRHVYAKMISRHASARFITIFSPSAAYTLPRLYYFGAAAAFAITLTLPLFFHYDVTD